MTLKTPYGTYEVTKEISIPKSMSWWEAFDCNGNKIMDTGGSVSMGTGKTTVRTYILKTLFPTTQKQEELENSNSVTESYSDSQYSGGGYSSRVVVPPVGGDLYEYTNMINIEGGYGFPYGGVGVRLKYTSFEILGVSVGYGYNVAYKSESSDNNKYLWNLGLQLHHNFLACSFYVGPQYFKKVEKSEIAMGFFLEFDHTIYKRLTLTAGVGGVIQAETPIDQAIGQFSWHVGLGYNLFRH